MISQQLSKVQDPNKILEYKFHEGLFVLFNDKGDVNYYHTCRDSFAGRFDVNTNILGFHTSSGPALNIELINHFFEEFIEQKLEIKDSVVFHLSNIPNLLVVEVGEFWRRNFMSRSLFTLLLRCAAIYGKNNLNESLNAYPLAKYSIEPVNFFLEGNTTPLIEKWSSYCNGFVSEFKDCKDKGSLSKKLGWIKFEKKPGEYFATAIQ